MVLAGELVIRVIPAPYMTASPAFQLVREFPIGYEVVRWEGGVPNGGDRLELACVLLVMFVKCMLWVRIRGE
jgi:hypothetical protein